DIDLRRTVDIMKDIPDGRVIVSESGIETRDDVEMLDGKGIDALLIGTSLMKPRDIGSRINELFRGIWYNG
ncbi:MAG TPA: indole-3-glycerol phosphate synthase, partial [Nitrospirae bacterium]|nr:indole-3-glycerol phosphate synthase [Nitrospirota bacterium]